jgi:hypothetical protein
MRHFWLFLLLVPALTACSEIQHHRNIGYAPVVTRGFGTEYWLTELNRTRHMTSEEIQQTASSWEQEFHEEPTDGNRIRLTLLLTAGDERVRDLQRARSLLDGVAEVPASISDRELLTIIRQILYEHERSSESLSKLNMQLKKQNLRIEELEQQLRALTDIEQNIQQRDTQMDTDHVEQ